MKQVERVRRICMALPGTREKLSHGGESWFVGSRAFVMFMENHHGDGRIAVWLPVPRGMQEPLIESSPDVYFKPPYVGVRGWVGIQLGAIEDDDLRFYIETAWELVAPKRLAAAARSARADVKRRKVSA